MKRIPPFQLVPHGITEEARNLKGFKWAGRDIGKRHQLGGSPQFMEKAEWPKCCQREMTFYGQLDSINDDICIADCGLIYVFLCFDCFRAEAVVHSA